MNAASALAAEAEAARVAAAGGAGVVLRFGMFYGPGVYHTEALLRMARWGLAYGAGAAHGYMSMVHVDDAATAVVAALAAPAGVYDVVDDEPVTSADFAAALAAGGRPSPPRAGPGAPDAPRRPPGRIAPPLAAGRQPPLPRGDGLGAGAPRGARGSGVRRHRHGYRMIRL